MAQNPRITIDISWQTLFRVVALLLGLGLIVLLREVIVLLLIVFIFVAAVNPTIIVLQKYMSRSLAVVLFFAALVLILIAIISLFVPSVVHQINELIGSYPTILEKLKPYLSEGQANQSTVIINQLSSSASNFVQSLSGDVLSRGASLFGGIFTFLSFLIISFYLLLEEKNAKEFFHSVLPPDKFEAVYVTVQKISEKMGYWIRGQLTLMLIIAGANLVSYLIIGVPAPLPLAMWAGFCEAIPYIGPVLGMTPAVLVLLVNGDILHAVLVLVVSFFLIQQVESTFIVPRIMGRAIGLSPVLVVLAIVVGAKVFGVVGAVIAVPAAAIISVIVQEWPQLHKVWMAQRRRGA
jgi:predicted PurR-regulated permease PerM